jgi:putative flippase GtrA
VPTLRELASRAYANQPLRFLVVGGWNTGSGYLVFALLYYFLSPHIHYLAILALTVVVNVTNAFLCYKFIVFRTRGNYLREYLRFYAVYAVPIGLGFVLLPFAIEVLKLNAYVAQALVTLFLAGVSYLGHKHISFRRAAVDQKNGR